MSSNTLDETRGGYPDSLAGKLGWVAMSAALISLFFCTNSYTKCCKDVFNLFVLKHLVLHCFFYVKNFTS